MVSNGDDGGESNGDVSDSGSSDGHNDDGGEEGNADALTLVLQNVYLLQPLPNHN